MSGSSVDGLDIAYCIIEETGGKWSYTIEHSICVPFTPTLKASLVNATALQAQDLFVLDAAFGKWMGEKVNEFIEQNNLQHKVHLIGSHGHTVFHNPQAGISVQIGCGATLAAISGINVVNNLRMMDVALQGNGAPIIPIAEQLLLPNNKMFLNIGGICNISIAQQNNYIAFDVCPANRVLNELAANLGQPYDDAGNFAKEGIVDAVILEKLNALDYYKKDFPKSLANEFGLQNILPLLNTLEPKNALATMVSHIAIQVKNAINAVGVFQADATLLVTGGGAYNTFLINKINEQINPLDVMAIVPDDNTINFKEALGMALIAVLRWREENNVYSSVTGALRNSIGGALWLGDI